MFLYWTGNGNEYCIQPNIHFWWGALRPFIQFKNGQLYTEDCIGKFQTSNHFILTLLPMEGFHRDEKVSVPVHVFAPSGTREESRHTVKL